MYIHLYYQYLSSLRLIFFVPLVFVSCATGYIKSTLGKAGYNEKHLEKNIFQISFKGNAYTSRERVLDLLSLRSADLALSEGYKYYIIEYSVNLSVNNSGTKVKMRNGMPVYSAYDGGVLYYHYQHEIICYKKRPEEKGEIYDAQDIFSRISKKYAFKNKRNK